MYVAQNLIKIFGKQKWHEIYRTLEMWEALASHADHDSSAEISHRYSKFIVAYRFDRYRFLLLHNRQGMTSTCSSILL